MKSLFERVGWKDRILKRRPAFSVRGPTNIYDLRQSAKAGWLTMTQCMITIGPMNRAVKRWQICRLGRGYRVASACGSPLQQSSRPTNGRQGFDGYHTPWRPTSRKRARIIAFSASTRTGHTLIPASFYYILLHPCWYHPYIPLLVSCSDT